MGVTVVHAEMIRMQIEAENRIFLLFIVIIFRSLISKLAWKKLFVKPDSYSRGPGYRVLIKDDDSGKDSSKLKGTSE